MYGLDARYLRAGGPTGQKAGAERQGQGPTNKGITAGECLCLVGVLVGSSRCEEGIGGGGGVWVGGRAGR